MKIIVRQCQNTNKFYITTKKSGLFVRESDYIAKDELFRNSPYITTWSSTYCQQYCGFDTEEQLDRAIEAIKQIHMKKLKLKVFKVVKI